MGSLSGIVTCSKQFDISYKKLSPFFIPKVLVNMAAGHVSIRHKLKGPNHAVATACAAGAMSIGDAYNFIRLNYADVMLCGGVECSTDPLTGAGFARMKALSTCADPAAASRPFDTARDGFVIGEGSGVLVLETLDNVIKRGGEKHILAEICGYGMSGDATHITSPPADGDGGKRAMLSALRDAGDLCPSLVGYVNAHATSTPAGDAAEVAAIEAVFGPTSSQRGGSPLYVSSTKGATGHLLGAAGAVEAAFSIMALGKGDIPPTVNLVEPDADPSSFRHVLENKSVSAPDLKYVMTNSFGFGGVNVSLIFKKFAL
jgi:3-oxoacyl-[acyl-carrier-protein] synthase II